MFRLQTVDEPMFHYATLLDTRGKHCRLMNFYTRYCRLVNDQTVQMHGSS